MYSYKIISDKDIYSIVDNVRQNKLKVFFIETQSLFKQFIKSFTNNIILDENAVLPHTHQSNVSDNLELSAKVMTKIKNANKYDIMLYNLLKKL